MTALPISSGPLAAPQGRLRAPLRRYGEGVLLGAVPPKMIDCANSTSFRRGGALAIAATFVSAMACGSCSSGSGSSPDSGGASGSGSGSSLTGCPALAACCPTLPATQLPSDCRDVAASGTITACGESLMTYQEAGFCGGNHLGAVDVSFSPATLVHGVAAFQLDIYSADGSSLGCSPTGTLSPSNSHPQPIYTSGNASATCTNSFERCFTDVTFAQSGRAAVLVVSGYGDTNMNVVASGCATATLPLVTEFLTVNLTATN